MPIGQDGKDKDRSNEGGLKIRPRIAHACLSVGGKQVVSLRRKVRPLVKLRTSDGLVDLVNACVASIVSYAVR